MSQLPSHIIEQAIRHTVYNLETRGKPMKSRHRVSLSHLRWPLIFGLLGSLGMAAFYMGFVTLVGSWDHALSLFREDAFFVAPITLGFGIQVGLFTYLKRGLHLTDGTRAVGAVTGTTGGLLLWL